MTTHSHVLILDQLSLPYTVHWDRVSTAQEAFEAIKSMRVRPCPLGHRYNEGQETHRFEERPLLLRSLHLVSLSMFCRLIRLTPTLRRYGSMSRSSRLTCCSRDRRLSI